MSKLRAALGAVAVTGAVVGFTAPPAQAFPCTSSTGIINTGPVGIPGVATVQVCSEGVRVLPTGEVTSVTQVGVTLDGQEICVGLGRVTVDTSPVGVQSDPNGLFGTPVFLTCPGS